MVRKFFPGALGFEELRSFHISAEERNAYQACWERMREYHKKGLKVGKCRVFQEDYKTVSLGQII